MEIIVIVPDHIYGYAFLVDLGELWQFQRITRDRVQVGRLQYRMIPIESDYWRGTRPDLVYAYNCDRYRGRVANLLRIFEYFKYRNVQVMDIRN